MPRFFVHFIMLFTALLIANPAWADRITVSSGIGDSLLEACAQSSDNRLVSTNKGTFNGCCSKMLGYCILCPSTGECYKFSHMRSLNKFLRDFAPNGNVIVNEEPVRPSRNIKKPAPSNRAVLE